MKIFLLLFSTILLFTGNALAAVIPVIDPAEIAKTVELINQAKNQLSQLKDLSKLNNKQYDFLKNNLNGNFGYGNLLNDASSLKKRQWANDNWTDVLKESNNGRTSAFTAAQKKYDALYPVRKPDDIATTRSKNNLTRTEYQQASEISRAALASSSYSYDQINEHIKNLHDILAKLEDKQSEKAAIDINARLVAEVGFIQLEMLRQQNIQTQLAATESQKSVNGMSEQSQFIEWKNNN